MDISLIVQGAAALLLVLALIVLIAWVLKRYFGGGTRQGQPALRKRNRRLGVIEAAPLGARHRLVLIRRDDVEHLLLIGGASELVVESGIPRTPSVAEVSIRSAEPHFEAGGLAAPAERYDALSTQREPEISRDYPREPFDRPGLERAYRQHDHDRTDRERDDLRPPHDYDEEEQVDFAPRFARDEPHDFRPGDRPGFHRPEPSPFGRGEHGALFPDRGESHYRADEPRLGSSLDDEPDHEEDELEAIDRRDTVHDEVDAEEEDDREHSAQSRILSRFLKRDET